MPDRSPVWHTPTLNSVGPLTMFFFEHLLPLYDVWYNAGSPTVYGAAFFDDDDVLLDVFDDVFSALLAPFGPVSWFSQCA